MREIKFSNRPERTGSVAQVVKHLPSKYDALSSRLKKKKKDQRDKFEKNLSHRETLKLKVKKITRDNHIYKNKHDHIQTYM
jgi:hypothetical protein